MEKKVTPVLVVPMRKNPPLLTNYHLHRFVSAYKHDLSEQYEILLQLPTKISTMLKVLDMK